MEAEYIALSISFKDLLPIVGMVSALGYVVDVSIKNVTNVHTRAHEYIVGAITLAGLELEPCCMTPHLKNYAIKYYHFWEHVQTHHVILVKIVT